MMEARRILSHSSAKAYRLCPRLYRYRYVDGYEPHESAHALRFGTIVHAALEAWWRAEGDERLDAALAALSGDVDPVDAAKARAMVTLYHERWAAAPLRVLAVELEYRTELRNPATGYPSQTWNRGGRIDAIAEDEHGRVWVVEHKTSSEDFGPGSDYAERLTMDSQISHYMAGARALGYEPAGCLYDVVGKPRHDLLRATPEASRRYTRDGRLDARQREHDETIEAYEARLLAEMAENPDRYVRRFEVVRLEQDVADAAHDDWQTASAIRESQRADRWPRNPDACIRYGRRCEFWPVCTRRASLDEYKKR